MATRTKKQSMPAPVKRDPAILKVDERFCSEDAVARYKAAATEAEREPVEGAMMAKALSEPMVRAASVIQKYEGEGLNVNDLVDELREQVAEVNGGEMTRPEAMLISQAHTLDALFCYLSKRAHSNMGEYLDATDRYLRLALKAQAQAVRTIEVLGELKFPRSVAFVKQANIAHGPQQVNNGTIPRAQETDNQPNKQSGGIYELPANTGTPSLESTAYPAVEALGEINRAEVARGQGQGEPECLQRRLAAENEGVECVTQGTG